MRNLVTIALSIILLTMPAGESPAREKSRSTLRVMRDWSDDEFTDPALLDGGVRNLYTSAQVDTYCLVWYDFETMDWQGWTRKDYTAQEDTFTHIDDFIPLGGGQWEKLTPLEGLQSMWCGARDLGEQIFAPYPCPGDHEYLCQWSNGLYSNGYGNNWSQMLMTDPIPFSGILTFCYKGYFDSEPLYDKTRVQVDLGGNNWATIATY